MQMQVVAVGWQMYNLTGSALDLGLVGLVQFLPAVLLTLVVGHVADRYDRRRVVLLGLVVRAVTVAVLAAASATGWITREWIFAMVAVIGAARAFEMPTMQALLPAVVGPALLPRAVAWMASATQAAIIVGPVLGGFFYVAGPATVYGISAVLCLVAGLLVSNIPVVRIAGKREPASWATIFAGIGFIRSQPVVLGAVSLDLFAVLLGGATALLPIFARDILATGPWGLGLLRAAQAIGALGTALYLTRHPLERKVGRIMFASVAIFGVGTIVFALSKSFALSFAALVVLGAADMVSVVIRASLIQLDTPDHMRGRVSAVNSIFIGASNQLGEFESGLTAAWFGTVPSVVIGGVGTLLIAALWIRLFPGLAQRDRVREA